jgi:hypothetical protein
LKQEAWQPSRRPKHHAGAPREQHNIDGFHRYLSNQPG